MTRFTRRDWLFLAAGNLVSLPMAHQAIAADYFSGKTLHFYVGIPPGGAYDLAPRILAAHLGKYIPGNPRIIVENMPGAGSLTMMNYLYNRAAKDGTAIGFPMNTVLLEPSLKLVSGASGNAQFDLSRMIWVGTPGQDPAIAWVGANSPIKTFADLRTQSPAFASTGAGADSTILANLCNKLLGTKIKVVSGYKGVADYIVAFERGEIEGGVTTYAALMTARPDWFRDGKIRVLAQFGTDRISDLPDVPTAVELATDHDVKEMLRLYGIKFTAAYPIVLPPDVPTEQAKILQSAFAQTAKDPEYQRQIAMMRVSGGMVSPETVTKLLKVIDDAPDALVQQLRAAIAGN
ncbi:MAG: uncharacterized protein JWO28_229 [Hyphomicrobiales bacterium]|nr:uncharacterized protein [Hyphomicrobiales bacterium]